MGDLKTFFDKAAYPDTADLAGDLATSRGSDPNSEGDNGQGAALHDFWSPGPYPNPPNQPDRALPERSLPGNQESSNSVSGLPPLPNRYEPQESTPEKIENVPDLTRRSPGTIDQQ